MSIGGLYADDLYAMLDKNFTRIRRMDVKPLRAKSVKANEFPFIQTNDNKIVYSSGKEASYEEIANELIPTYRGLGANTYLSSRLKLADHRNGDKAGSILFYRAPWHRLFAYRAQRFLTRKKI